MSTQFQITLKLTIKAKEMIVFQAQKSPYQNIWQRLCI